MKKSMMDIFSKLMFNILKNYILFKGYNDLPLLPEKMKIEKVKMLVANLHNKTEYKHIRNLKQALNH